jgi:single-stranded DNA-specific DHH superfamily exonuclease
LIFALNFPRVGRALSTTAGDVARVVWRPAIAGLVMYALVVAFRHLLADTSDIVRLAVLAAIGAIGYLGTLHMLDRRIYRDFISLLRPGKP